MRPIRPAPSNPMCIASSPADIRAQRIDRTTELPFHHQEHRAPDGRGEMPIRLTMAQALVGYLAAQRTEIDGKLRPLFAGVWAIFGHGNVAALGEALARARDRLPTYRAHNEQAMAHAAIAFAKASRRRRMTACTTSIGPGATN